MLPSVEAFLALWDDPVEFVEVGFNYSNEQLTGKIIIDAPNNPKLEIHLHPIQMGRA